MNPLPTSWLVGAGSLLAIASFLAGGYVGKGMCENGYFKVQQKAEQKHEQVVAGAQEQDQQAADHEVGRQAQVREIVREVPTVIDRPVYRNVCVDADGVRLIRRAVDAANDGSTSSGSTGEASAVRPAAGDSQPADRRGGADR